MCDKCDLDLAIYGELREGFRCSNVTEDLLAEEANGIPRFPNRKKSVGQRMADGSGEYRKQGDETNGR